MPEISDWADYAWKYALPFGFGAVLMAAINKSVLIYGFHSIYPPETWNYVRICIHPIFAAVQEPLTSKFLPASVIVYLSVQRDAIENVRRSAFRLGVLGGFTVGIIEALSKMLDQLEILSSTLTPILMHTLTGAIIGTTIFRLAGRDNNARAGVLLLAAYLIAVLVHYLYNTQIVFWLAGFNPC